MAFIVVVYSLATIAWQGITGRPPAGPVTIKAGSVTICAITLRGGKGTCTLTLSKLRPGTYQLVASYAARTPYAASTSAKKTLRVTN